MSSELLFNYAESLRTQGRFNILEDGIKSAKYRHGKIFDGIVFLDSLRFMGPPFWWYYNNHGSNVPIAKEGRIYEDITNYSADGIVSLRMVAQRIINKYGRNSDNSADILYVLGQEHDWYKRFYTLRAYFDVNLMSPLWVRTWDDRKTLYLEDGNTRALVYAIRLLCHEVEFEPVDIIWCRSWRHVLSWADVCEGERYDSPSDIDKIAYTK